MWQHRYIHLLAIMIGMGLPAVIGGIWDGWDGALGGLLLGGVAKTVVLQHCTFFINSACHTVGRQPYSTKCSARDSFLMALFTFGEGYHNYHHEFQHDYRNGVMPWQWDPTKWIIWTLSKFKLITGLRRVPAETIAAAKERSRHEAETGENDSDIWAVLPLVFPTPAQPVEAQRIKTRL